MKKTFCRYISNERENRHLEQDVNGVIYLASWNELNDPMEGYFRSYIVGNNPKSSNIVSNIVHNKTNYRIKSFSCKNNNPLLWSYYANGYKGLCIEYLVDEAELRPNVTIHKISYSDTIPFVNNLSERNIDVDMETVKILTTKMKYWEHENERRMLIKGVQGPIKLEVKKIIFGCKCDQNLIDKVKSMVPQDKKITSKVKFAKASFGWTDKGKSIISINNMQLFSHKVNLTAGK